VAVYFGLPPEGLEEEKYLVRSCEVDLTPLQEDKNKWVCEGKRGRRGEEGKKRGRGEEGKKRGRGEEGGRGGRSG
jgi:hypothetical protein